MFNTKISSSTHTYNIVVQKGIKLDTELENTFYLMDRRFKSNFQVSENVFYLDALESCKNLQAVEDAIRAMVEKRINRTSQLIVVGGGLIQDVGTLVASLYMRGIKWIYVPTTFMAMVDSCIGGKSSINVANYKNIVGNIYPPQEIQIYTDFTNTLTAIDIVSGELEAIKICFAKGKDSFDEFVKLLNASKTSPLELPALISHVISSKKHFVEKDEFDTGIRQLLNFGHTFGHALESASNYRIPHGVAIGMGMLAAMDFTKSHSNPYHEELTANILGIFSKIKELVPELINSIDFNLFKTAFQADKKHTSENFALIVPIADGLQILLIPRNQESLDRVMTSLKSGLEQLRALHDR